MEVGTFMRKQNRPCVDILKEGQRVIWVRAPDGAMFLKVGICHHLRDRVAHWHLVVPEFAFFGSNAGNIEGYPVFLIGKAHPVTSAVAREA